jgi:hypothetical protein
VGKAGPLELKQVAADAKWVGHIDFDAIRASTIVKKIEEKIREKHKGADKHLAMAKFFLGMDPRKDLHGVTFYGKEIGKPKGVMLLHAKMDYQTVLGLASHLPGHEVTKDGATEIHSWTHKGHRHTFTIAAVVAKPDRLVVASSVAELKAALGVLKGKIGGVGSESLLAGATPEGTTVLFRITGIAEAAKKAKHLIVKQTESFHLAMGESQGQSFFQERIVMTDPGVVGNLKTITEGIKALGILHCNGNELGLKLVKALEVKAEDKTLEIRWSGSANEVWDMMELHCKKFAELKAKFGPRFHGPRAHRPVQMEFHFSGKAPVKKTPEKKR